MIDEHNAVARWEYTDRDMTRLEICGPGKRRRWSAFAREKAWALQDGQANEYAHGVGDNLSHCQEQALNALRTVINAELAQLPNASDHQRDTTTMTGDAQEADDLGGDAVRSLVEEAVQSREYAHCMQVTMACMNVELDWEDRIKQLTYAFQTQRADACADVFTRMLMIVGDSWTCSQVREHIERLLAPRG